MVIGGFKKFSALSLVNGLIHVGGGQIHHLTNITQLYPKVSLSA
jgi:hypothetical protein